MLASGSITCLSWRGLLGGMSAFETTFFAGKIRRNVNRPLPA